MGFLMKVERDYYSAVLNTERGRIHTLFTEIVGKGTYCDVHCNGRFHFLWLGVDYHALPVQFYRSKLLPRLQSKGLSSEIVGGLSWFTRKNRAILRGLKLRFNMPKGVESSTIHWKSNCRSESQTSNSTRELDLDVTLEDRRESKRFRAPII